MNRTKTLLALAFVLVACGGSPSSAPSNTRGAPSSSAGPSSSCAAQTAELKTWLAINADPNKKLDAPWPTGDAVFDVELDKWRTHLRVKYKSPDTGERVELPEGIMPGPYDKLIASCEPAKAATKQVSEAVGFEGRVVAWPKLADAIAACNCQPAVAHIKAHVYIMERGPD